MKEPKLDTEFGWCVFKGMFILLIFTNLLWACIHFGYVYKSFNGTSMEALQGRINQLELNNAVAGVVRYPTNFSYNAGPSPFCGGCGCNGAF